MVLALIVNVMLPILFQFKLPNDPPFADIILLFAASLVLLTLAIGAPALANGMVFGTPVMHGGDVLRTAFSMAQTGAAIGGVGAAVSIAGAAALRGTVTGASAMTAAAHVGAANRRDANFAAGNFPVGGLGTSIAGGAQGISQYLRNRTTEGFRQAVANGRIRSTRNMNP